MEYARLELTLVRGGWSRGIVMAGAVSGSVEAVRVDLHTVQVTHTTLTRRAGRTRTPRQDAAVAAVSAHLAPATSSLLTLNTRVAGPSGRVGKLSRLWVSRLDARISHLLVRVRGADEHIVPMNLVESLGRTQVRLKVDRDTIRRLFVYRPDRVLTNDVRLALDAALANPRARRDVKIQVTDGEVVLAGEVDTLEQMRQAERAARSVTGVRGIANDLVVQEALAIAVEDLLPNALGVALRDAHVRVFAEHGIVHLEGSVATPQQRADVERAALSASGVKVVVNHLLVNGQPPERNPGTGPLVRNR